MNNENRKSVIEDLEKIMEHEVLLATRSIEKDDPSSERKDAVYNASIIAETMGARWWDTDETEDKPSFNKEQFDRFLGDLEKEENFSMCRRLCEEVGDDRYKEFEEQENDKILEETRKRASLPDPAVTPDPPMESKGNLIQPVGDGDEFVPGGEA